MSLPSTERSNPRDVARAATLAGQFHDVVVSASKVLHGHQLEKADRASLLWARDLLASARQVDVMPAMPSANQLAGPGSTVVALRRAAGPDGGDPDTALKSLVEGVTAALRGRRDKDIVETMESLRRLFALVSRLALQSEVLAQSEPRHGRTWTPLTPTSSL